MLQGAAMRSDVCFELSPGSLVDPSPGHTLMPHASRPTPQSLLVCPPASTASAILAMEEVTAYDARTCCSAAALFCCASTCFSFEFVGFCFANADIRTACVLASRTFRAFSTSVLFDSCFCFLRVATRDIRCLVCIPLL